MHTLLPFKFIFLLKKSTSHCCALPNKEIYFLPIGDVQWREVVFFSNLIEGSAFCKSFPLFI
jgi:hypothetical protein